MPEIPINPEPVDTGDRRDERHYERSADQVVEVRHTFAPDQALPAQEQSAASEDGAPGAVPGLQDVAVTREASSVWDARPTDDGEDEAGR